MPLPSYMTIKFPPDATRKEKAAHLQTLSDYNAHLDRQILILVIVAPVIATVCGIAIYFVAH